MDFSLFALQRMAMKEMGKEKPGSRVFLEDGRSLPDRELTEKLKSFGVEMNESRFKEMVKNFLSAEEMFYHFIDRENAAVETPTDKDWVWICLVVLWERWAPGKPSFEMIDDLMQKGYDFWESREVEKACDAWLTVWNWVLTIMTEQNMRRISDFDEKFRGTQIVENWISDLEMELGTAGNHDPKYFRERVEFAGNFLSRFPGENIEIIRNMKRALAESYNKLGDIQKAGSLFEAWLEDDPQWGWGWIGYSDCYWLESADADNPDYEKAENILRNALATPGVQDREHILERLKDLYDETGKPWDAEEWDAPDEEPAPQFIRKAPSITPPGKKEKKKKK